MPKNLLKLIFAIGICLGVGVLGSFFTASAIPNWYTTLNKPFFSPPSWVFGPVWTILYVMMGVSLYLIVISNKASASLASESVAGRQVTRQNAIRIFEIQLFLNFIWSIIFFSMRNPVLAFVDIIALWAVIVLTIKAFYPISKMAAYLLIPYLLWVSFASILNLAIVFLN